MIEQLLGLPRWLISALIGFLGGLIGPSVVAWIKGKVERGEEKNQTQLNKENVEKMEEKLDDLKERVSRLEGKTENTE